MYNCNHFLLYRFCSPQTAYFGMHDAVDQMILSLNTKLHMEVLMYRAYAIN